MSDFLHRLVVKIAAAILLLFAGVSAGHADALRIGDRVFKLANSQQSKAGDLREYVPAGESIETWRHLVAVRHFRKLKSPGEYIRAMDFRYREDNPNVKHAVASSKDPEQWFFDAIMFSKQGDPQFVEWNFFSARQAPEGGIVVYQYAERAPYRSTISEAMATLGIPALRKKMLPILGHSIFVVRP